MSLINKMLQDLDRRDAASAGEAAVPPPQVRPVAAPGSGHELFWRIFAGLMLIAVVWVLWVAYQLMPRSLATDAAFAAADAARGKTLAPVAAGQKPDPQPVPPQAALPEPQPQPEPEPKPKPAPQPQPAPAAPAPAPASAPMEILKLAGQISTPVPEAPAAEAAKPLKPEVKAAVKPEPKPVAKAEPKPAAIPEPKPAAEPTLAKLAKEVPQARIIAAPVAAAKVERRDRVRTPAERAEAEFRRAVALLNQGRASEAEDGLSAALAADTSHEAARQALVALHLEKRQTEDARRLLQEGLAINPGQQQFAAVLARILIERRDYAGALEQIGNALGNSSGNADLLALRGAALQRLGRHSEAADTYDAALRISPQSGSSWLGLAISLEALARRADAAAAYRRAVASGALAAEARDYAEQRAGALR